MSLNPLLDELAILPDGWQDSRIGRIEATRDSPRLFAYLYLRPTLKAQTDVLSFSPVHHEWYEKAKTWMTPGMSRDVYIAPRSMGKTSTWFLLVPLWAAAHRHTGFVAAFSDSSTQAEEHLRTFRHTIEANELLRYDYPHLATFKVDNVAMLQTTGGFVFAAKGADSSSLGLKVGNQRPDVLVLDDIEPGSNYSAYQVGRRLETVTDVILPLNDQAKVVMVGTAVMTGSLIHQAVMHEAQPAQWIKDEMFEIHHALPFDEHGESIWPERWSTEYLRAIEHTRSFAKSFLSQPVALDGEYWQEEDFAYGTLPTVSRRIIAVDPAVTTKRTSDETGVAVVGFSSAVRRVVVNDVRGVRLKGEPLRQLLLDLVAAWPDTAYVLWESNQGGDALPASVLHDFPLQVHVRHQHERKEVRMERLLSFYRRGLVLHERKFPMLEAQMQEFPQALHDDLPDCVGLAVDEFAGVGRKSKGTLSVAVR